MLFAVSSGRLSPGLENGAKQPENYSKRFKNNLKAFRKGGPPNMPFQVMICRGTCVILSSLILLLWIQKSSSNHSSPIYVLVIECGGYLGTTNMSKVSAQAHSEIGIEREGFFDAEVCNALCVANGCICQCDRAR